MVCILCWQLLIQTFKLPVGTGIGNVYSRYLPWAALYLTHPSSYYCQHVSSIPSICIRRHGLNASSSSKHAPSSSLLSDSETEVRYTLLFRVWLQYWILHKVIVVVDKVLKTAVDALITAALCYYLRRAHTSLDRWGLSNTKFLRDSHPSPVRMGWFVGWQPSP